MEETENNTSNNYLNIDELEKYSIKCLLLNQTLLSRFISSIKVSYFHTSSNAIIFRIIKSYYNDLQVKIPKDEIPLRLESILPKSNSEDKNKNIREQVLNQIEEIYNSEDINVESANKNVSNFIMRRVSEEALNELVTNMTDTNSDDFKEKSFYAIENCVKKIRESTNISIGNKEPYNLADLARLKEVREEALGNNETNRVIKLYIKSMNDIMQYDGISVGSVVCVTATPGCFTGDTRIMTLDGKSETLENLYNSKEKNLEVYSFDKDNRKINISLAESVYLSKYENELVYVEIDGEHIIKCTLDHPFLTRDGIYKQAKDLVVGDSLEAINRKINIESYDSKITSIEIVHLNKSVPVYGLYNVLKNHNYALALTNNNGIFVSNSGKTTFLLNQGLYSASQGLKVAHCFIGDMEYFDGLIRYYTCYTESENSKIMVANKILEKEINIRKRALKKFKEGSDPYLNNLSIIEEKEEQVKRNLETDKMLESEGRKKIVLDSRQMVQYSQEDLEKILASDPKFLSIAKNVDIYKYASSEISMDALREEIYNFQKQKGIHYDLIIIDYDGNLKQPADSMYESGGIIYDQAKNLAQVNHSVVFMASQPKQSYWKNELIPIEACAESSKKQMIIDLLITIGRPEGVNTGIRKIYIPKNRRGKENEIFHARMNGETGFMYEIFQEEYDLLKKAGYDPTLVITSGNKKKEEQKVDEGPKSNLNNIKI